MGLIFNIQRFSVNDGPGIRTSVFMKGCPLKCTWCHNPESISGLPVLSYNETQCIGCGRCVPLCPRGLHLIEPDGRHSFNRNGCIACGACASDGCQALDIIGTECSADEIMQIVLRDREFYKQSGGGMTLTGGEPMYNFEFAAELMRLARENGISTCVETSGFAPWERFEAVLQYVELFLFDIKETDERKHREFTGVSNRLIMDNLRLLDQRGARIVLRCPIIPGYNLRDEHLERIAEIAERTGGVEKIEVEPYHALGNAKAIRIGFSPVDISVPTENDVGNWISYISSRTGKPVERG